MAAVSKLTEECSLGTFKDHLELPNKNLNLVCMNKEELKNKRRSFSYEEKLKIINSLDTLSKEDVCGKFTLDYSTLNKWIKKSSEIKEICKNNYTKKLKKQKTTDIKELDGMLYTWFLSQRARGAPLSGPILKAQALAISESLGIKSFKASNHWLDGWKKRKDVRLLRIQGDTSADVLASVDFKAQFKRMINENGLTRAQVFNFDESMLNFKMLPAYTFVSSDAQRASGFTKDKSRVTFAACSNADGSLKIPIVIIGRSAKPRVLKSRSVEQLPVFYTHSKTAGLINTIFRNWFETEFVPKVQRFLRVQGLPMKAVLLVDNCKSHMLLSVGDIKIEFFPSNITQPMDQGILETLKKRYRLRLVSSIVEAGKKGTSITEHLKSISMNDVFNWLSEAWNEIPTSTIYRCWRKIWPVDIHDVETQTEPTSEILTPLYLMGENVENESDETIFNKLVNSDEILQSLRTLQEFTKIEKGTVDSWMMNNEDWENIKEEENWEISYEETKNENDPLKVDGVLIKVEKAETAIEFVPLESILTNQVTIKNEVDIDEGIFDTTEG